MPIADVSPPRVVAHWRRFSSGLWRVPRGDIDDAYSADRMPRVKVFTHDGRLFTNTGCVYSKRFHSEVDGYLLIPADEYYGPESIPYSYAGNAAVYQGKQFRLGAKTVFVPSDPSVNEWRQLLRATFADGGIFASGCTYPVFLTERCPPESPNGETATQLEIADCEGGHIPQAKDEMRQWLDTGKRIIARQLDLGLQ